MHAIDRKDVPSLIEKVAVFAGKEIATRHDLHNIDDFPRDIWRKMAKEGLLSLGIPVKYGGTKIAYDTLVLVGEALVSHGHNMGLALSWIIHLLASGFMIGKFGTPPQRAEYLPKMADGLITASIAFSELRAGADPRHLEHDGPSGRGPFYFERRKGLSDQWTPGGLLCGLCCNRCGRREETVYGLSCFEREPESGSHGNDETGFPQAIPPLHDQTGKLSCADLLQYLAGRERLWKKWRGLAVHWRMRS